MPTAITERPSPPAPPQPPRKRWTRAECAAIESLGFWDQENFELVDGELISRRPKKRPRSIAIAKLMRWLVQMFGWDFVHQEVPIDVSPQDNAINEPEPDLIVLKRTTLTFDTTTKASVYARAGDAFPA